MQRRTSAHCGIADLRRAGGEQLSARTTSTGGAMRCNEHEVIYSNDGRKIGRIDIEGGRMTRSHDLFQQAQRHIPGGGNSPVRAFRGVGGDPVFFKRGEGAYLFDEDGKQYIDYVGSWGPMILGHAHPAVIAAVKEAADNGLGFGAPTTIETEMAEKVCALVPSIEMVRMVSSGTEATMSAIRLARGYTGRDKIVKFEGCYHGHSDSLLVKAGSGALTLGVPSSAGVPAALAEHTLTLNYNDLDQVRETFAQLGGQIACIIVEPVAGNMNCVPPKPGFLQGLRAICDEYESVLIFDEVMPGFRVALGGAQEYYNVTPARAFDIPLATTQVGGMFGLFFTEEKEIRDYYQVTNCNVERFKLFFHGMLEQGVYLAPSAYEAGFVSAAHGHREIKNTVIASEQVFSRL